MIYIYSGKNAKFLHAQFKPGYVQNWTFRLKKDPGGKAINLLGREGGNFIIIKSGLNKNSHQRHGRKKKFPLHTNCRLICIIHREVISCPGSPEIVCVILSLPASRRRRPEAANRAYPGVQRRSGRRPSRNKYRSVPVSQGHLAGRCRWGTRHWR